MSGLLLPSPLVSRMGRVVALAAVGALGVALVPRPVGGVPVVVAAQRAPAPAWQCAIPGAPDSDARPATDLRVALGRMLGEHAYLLMESMRATAGSLPEAEAARGAVDANSASLADAIGSVYGADAGSAFRTLWDTHVVAAIEFAQATAAGDTAGTDAARKKLDAFQVAFNKFLQKANPEIDADAEKEAVALHLHHLEDFASGDFSAAYDAARKAYGHMFDLGDMLARGIATQFPDRFPDFKVAFSPASELRIYLDRLLGEHLILAAEAMRAGVGDSPDFAAARQALDANAKDLEDAIGGVYGDDAGAAFGEVWAAHLVAYLDYIDAVRAGDQDRMTTVRQTLEGYGKVLGDFLAGANPKLGADDVAALISAHTASLIRMVDQYRGGDQAGAYETAEEAYLHMFMVGDVLAGAIASQFPERYSDLAELPRTDTAEPAHEMVMSAAGGSRWWLAR
jgi:hypothetical protein